MKTINIKNIILTIFIILFSFTFNIVVSVEPDEILENRNYEMRARNISKNIRCMICQNQSIDESNAPLAKDLRILIRAQIVKGKSDKEIYNFLTDRYGSFILLKPPFTFTTSLLWLLPFVFILIGFLIVLIFNNKSKKKE
tara:strand:+ start:239 stop:658 length:420 start_codon:yes stop_codon:yes gene_type:complete